MSASSPATPASSIAEALAEARDRIARAAEAAGRTDHPTLTAVTKTQAPDRVRAALDAGQRVFGENRVQEAQARWADRRDALADLELRLIGPLQTNKAAEAVALFDVIETVDRDRLIQALARAGERRGRAPRVLIQVNTGLEDQKAGVAPDAADALIASARAADLLVEGLMCIPPADAPPEPHFRLLAEIAARNGLNTLSMGMSDDFEAAIAAGATHVRLGSRLFGERKAPLSPS
ncbi:YggS family pyridoxal phosphate-dependent enzyme [Brevundimonas sp. S30B]|uniref:YggS family pyridoxal phosphate-dependent enzyme n=1 Tax=unclassified Brevundimonas TaxID=2622653 RepID=UPI00107190B4|nr:MULTISPECIES: YggS family pyridoxal phosphate-dependent enzyme [unclassified Brevundimonas]QBX36728.1 YggS family pyridoxal phosphate-dependent enzyme [Brevundimonas sp. MF30-B]TFW04477.1 YggS family pyridoxal phosphate-dependent enzyme [Brevundimonas sp. S30B]